jgi:hypothetical protein
LAYQRFHQGTIMYLGVARKGLFAEVRYQSSGYDSKTLILNKCSHDKIIQVSPASKIM